MDKEQEVKKDIEDIKEEKLPKIKLRFKKKILYLNEKSESKIEYDKIKKVLSDIYGSTLNIDKNLVLRCVSLTCSQENEKIHLPYNVIVEKKDDKLIFSSPRISNIFIVLLFLNILAFLTIAASYSAVDYLSKAELNKDIDGDGIPDINIDWNLDDVADINIDTNSDNIPDINIDYKGNRKSMFNIDTNDDNAADTNLVTRVEGNICLRTQVNCDVNGDGWPDINIDIDGDGVADVDMDKNEDGVIDLNIDTNRDGICDINCDSNHDWKCDYNCVTEIETITIVEQVKPSGSSKVTGNPSSRNETAVETLEVVFTDTEELVATDIYPDDQPGMEPSIPQKVFTIENKSPYIQYYNIKWVVFSNTFDENRNNMKFKVESTNGGGTLDWTTVPRMGSDYRFLTEVAIAPYVVQTYTLSLKLQGINAPQNYDKGKTFSGKLQVEISETVEEE